MLKRGDRGDEVKEMQQLLVRLNEVHPGIISEEDIKGFADGAFGPKTQAALERAQQHFIAGDEDKQNIMLGSFDDATRHMLTLIDADFASVKLGEEVRMTRATMPKESTEGLTYTVRSGDSLSLIAEQYEALDWKKLYKFNKDLIGDDPNKIVVGMELKIPEGHRNVSNGLALGKVVVEAVPLSKPFELTPLDVSQQKEGSDNKKGAAPS
jgi:LysM repeat protein